MFELTKKLENHTINCSAIKMGNDWNISIYGGELPHIGAVALGIPRLSLTDRNKISSSVSLLTITGHKEDIIVQRVAKKICSKLNRTVVICCGIHIDNITLHEIQTLDYIIDILVEELLFKIIHYKTTN